MKKRIVITILVLISIILGLGGIALAASPPDNKPTDAWYTMLEKIDMVLEDLFGVGVNVTGVQTSIDNVQSDIDDLETAIDGITTNISSIESEISHLPKMEADYGWVWEVDTGNLTVYDSGHYENGAHFVGQVRISGNCSSADWVGIEEYSGISSVRGHYMSQPLDEYEINFVGSRLVVKYKSVSDDDALIFDWGVMKTYADDSD